MPLHEQISEKDMEIYRSLTRHWRQVGRDLIRLYQFEHIKGNTSKNSNKFKWDIAVRRNYHRGDYDEGQDYTTIPVREKGKLVDKIVKINEDGEVIEKTIKVPEKGKLVDKVVFDGFNIGKYSVLFNVRASIHSNRFWLGYASKDRGIVKVKTGIGFQEIGGSSNLGYLVNELTEMHRDIIPKNPELYVLKTLELTNFFIGDKKNGTDNAKRFMDFQRELLYNANSNIY